MDLRQRLNAHVQLKWVVVGLAIAVFGVGGLSAMRYLHAQTADDDTVSLRLPDQRQDPLAEIEAILEDVDKDAETRIKEALQALREARASRSPASGLAGDPFADPWDSLASPWFSEDWDPFVEMDRMRRRMDSLYNDVFSRMRGEDSDGDRSLLRADALTWSPQGEIEKRDDAYIYRFDVPGVDKGEVSVTLENGRLIVEGSRGERIEESSEDRSFLRREVRRGHFRRVIVLPPDVDLDAPMRSTLENGVLTVTLPRDQSGESSMSKRIEVQ